VTAFLKIERGDVTAEELAAVLIAVLQRRAGEPPPVEVAPRWLKVVSPPANAWTGVRRCWSAYGRAA
jgi:hypothetical protein